MRHHFLGIYLHIPLGARSAAAIVTLSTDTDFAARTPYARECADRLALLAAGFDARTPEALLAVAGDSESPRSILHEMTARLRERVEIEAVVVVVANEPVDNALARLCAALRTMRQRDPTRQVVTRVDHGEWRSTLTLRGDTLTCDMWQPAQGPITHSGGAVETAQQAEEIGANIAGDKR